MSTEKPPTTVVLELRSQALYAARTFTTKGTLLSDGAVRELAEAFLELHAEHRALDAAHETQDTALDEALRQRAELTQERDALLRAFPEYADPQAKIERAHLRAEVDDLRAKINAIRSTAEHVIGTDPARSVLEAIDLAIGPPLCTECKSPVAPGNRLLCAGCCSAAEVAP